MLGENNRNSRTEGAEDLPPIEGQGVRTRRQVMYCFLSIAISVSVSGIGEIHALGWRLWGEIFPGVEETAVMRYAMVCRAYLS